MSQIVYGISLKDAIKGNFYKNLEKIKKTGLIGCMKRKKDLDLLLVLQFWGDQSVSSEKTSSPPRKVFVTFK